MNDATTTRARVCAGEADPPALLDLAVLPGDRRTPLALADVKIGPEVMTYAVAGLKRRKVEIRPLRAAEGESAITLPDHLQAAVKNAILTAATERSRRYRARRIPRGIPGTP